MFISYDNYIRNTSEAVDTLRYKITEPFSGLNVSMAYDQKYQLYGQYCYNCDTATRMESVMIDGESIEHWQEKNPTSDPGGPNYIQIEPITGLVTHMERSYTMVYSISCDRNSNCPNYS